MPQERSLASSPSPRTAAGGGKRLASGSARPSSGAAASQGARRHQPSASIWRSTSLAGARTR
jgi:hypothetical protein